MIDDDKDILSALVIGAALGAALVSIIWAIGTTDESMTCQAIERRGYDVDALASETEVDYWKARATGRVADPQPVKEEGDGR